ncbi:hypothetical protein PHPALM_31073 [Phytophthora palmivora]|uniref:Uncharacterized protein n=1 Tax=Phytophthora palmivora TaxID=4796 RepID=A0A2P4X3I1_9STRA|nr:hypothetical protein PHPALM_31073 [Phytophthora palmivora]
MNFPLTRSKMLSKLQDHRKTHKTAKRTMKNLLKHTVYEFEKLTYARSGEVDMTQWRALSKALAAHNGQQDNHVTVYSKRECDAMTTDLVYKLQANDSMLAALAPSAVLVSGEALGKVENIMYALGVAHTQCSPA